ncbi:hypothetical protein F4810DRAFT_718511 [Camillea tinctor]|nr:hypothetical protein F4810DRAFT_718511 [Camillea tinctor]
MENNNAPRMPLVASLNTKMTMSTTSSTSQRSNVPTTDPSEEKSDTAKTTETSRYSTSVDSNHVTVTPRTQTSICGQSLSDTRRDISRRREQALSVQRIELAIQLSDKHKMCVDLEAQIISLKDELAGFTFRNEALEIECTRLHGILNDANQQRECQAIDAAQREKAMREEIVELKTRLDETTKKLEKSIVDHHILQEAYDDVLENWVRQSDQVEKLSQELETCQTKLYDLTLAHDELGKKHHEVIKTISNMEKSHESRERDLQQRLGSKGAEAKTLKREIDTLRSACADAVKKKDNAERLHAEAENHLAQELKKVQELEKARDQSLAESQKLLSLQELEKSSKPSPQTIIICVDISGSVTPVIHEVKQVYRDVLHMVKSVNENIQVGVVIHGGYSHLASYPVEAISEATFQIMDTHDGGDSEDYTHCLKEAYDLFKKNADSRKLLILIGDGNALCSHRPSLLSTCEQLVSEHISTLSIAILPEPDSSCSGMQGISDATNGRLESMSTYMSALDELLHHERERNFESL